MSIPYANIASDCRASLDAEGNNVYDDLLDIIPALNKAQDYLTSLITPKLGNKKFNEEVFKGMLQTRIYQPSVYSRIYLDASIPTWGIIAVVVNPTVAIPPASSSTWNPVSVPNADQSIAAPGYVYVGGGKAARRLNSQEWLSNEKNPLLDGYVASASEIAYAAANSITINVGYSYLSHIDNLSAIDPAMPYEITIRPFITSTTPVAVTYCKYPTRITAITGAGSILDWNPVFQMLLVKGTLKFMMEKIGDDTTIYNISEQDINTIVTIQS